MHVNCYNETYIGLEEWVSLSSLLPTLPYSFSLSFGLLFRNTSSIFVQRKMIILHLLWWSKLLWHSCMIAINYFEWKMSWFVMNIILHAAQHLNKQVPSLKHILQCKCRICLTGVSYLWPSAKYLYITQITKPHLSGTVIIGWGLQAFKYLPLRQR